MSDTHADTTQQTHAHGDHPTPRLYVQIALTLGVLTALEISTFYVDFGWASVPLLIVLMVVKFVLVAGFFMHLKYDTALFTRLMATGLIGALVLYAVVLLTFLGDQAGG